MPIDTSFVTNKNSRKTRKLMRLFGNRVGLTKADKKFGFKRGTMRAFFVKIKFNEKVAKSKEKNEAIEAEKMLRQLEICNNNINVF